MAGYSENGLTFCSASQHPALKRETECIAGVPVREVAPSRFAMPVLPEADSIHARLTRIIRSAAGDTGLAVPRALQMNEGSMCEQTPRGPERDIPRKISRDKSPER